MAFKIVENTTTFSFLFFEEKVYVKDDDRYLIINCLLPVFRPQRRATTPLQGRAYLDNNETSSCLNHCFCRLRGKHLHNCPIQRVRNGPDTSCSRRCQHHLDVFFLSVRTEALCEAPWQNNRVYRARGRASYHHNPLRWSKGKQMIFKTAPKMMRLWRT